VVKVGRIAGQFAKPRSSDIEKRDGDIELPSYRGDIINGIDFTPEASRIPDPARQDHGLPPVGCHAEPAARLRVRAAMPIWRTCISGCSASSADSPQGERYKELADRISETMDFMRAIGITSEVRAAAARDRFLHQPRSAAAGLRRGDDPQGLHVRRLVRHLRPHDLDRRPHPPADHAHVEFFRGIKNPIGLKCGPSLSRTICCELIDRSSTRSTIRRLTLIAVSAMTRWKIICRAHPCGGA
jgi:3-deoxy-7-phosphoheptulonate synthase